MELETTNPCGLPFEIWTSIGLIVREDVGCGALCNLARTCRACSRIFQPLIYEKVYFDDKQPKNARLSAYALLGTGELSDCVRELRLRRIRSPEASELIAMIRRMDKVRVLSLDGVNVGIAGHPALMDMIERCPIEALSIKDCAKLAWGNKPLSYLRRLHLSEQGVTLSPLIGLWQSTQLHEIHWDDRAVEQADYVLSRPGVPYSLLPAVRTMVAELKLLGETRVLFTVLNKFPEIERLSISGAGAAMDAIKSHPPPECCALSDALFNIQTFEGPPAFALWICKGKPIQELRLCGSGQDILLADFAAILSNVTSLSLDDIPWPDYLVKTITFYCPQLKRLCIHSPYTVSASVAIRTIKTWISDHKEGKINTLGHLEGLVIVLGRVDNQAGELWDSFKKGWRSKTLIALRDVFPDLVDVRITAEGKWVYVDGWVYVEQPDYYSEIRFIQHRLS